MSNLAANSSWAKWATSMVNDAKGMIVEGAVGGIAGHIATKFIKQHFETYDVVHLSTQALQDIAVVVHEQVSDAVRRELDSLTKGARGKLLAYAESGDTRLLDNAFFSLFDLPERWRSEDNPSVFGGYAFAASLHLAAILAKIPEFPGYIQTFQRLQAEYARNIVTLGRGVRRSVFAYHRDVLADPAEVESRTRSALVDTYHVLDTLGAGGYPSTVAKLHCKPSSDSVNQAWYLLKRNDYYMLIPWNSWVALDANNGGQLYFHRQPNSTNPNHLWKLTPAGRYAMIESVATKAVLDANGGSNVYLNDKPDQHNMNHVWWLSSDPGSKRIHIQSLSGKYSLDANEAY